MDERHDERQAAARSAHDDVIRALDESWASLRETLRGLVDHTPEPTADGVTAGAAAMHVARWDESTAELFRTWALDRAAPDPYSSHDKKWNALWLAQDADVDVADAVTRAEDAHLAFRAALAAPGRGRVAGVRTRVRDGYERALPVARGAPARVPVAGGERRRRCRAVLSLVSPPRRLASGARAGSRGARRGSSGRGRG